MTELLFWATGFSAGACTVALVFSLLTVQRNTKADR